MKFLINESQLKLLQEVVRSSINPRESIPKVRGGWNDKKVLKYLKEYSSPYSLFAGIKYISEFDNIDELKQHLFWHGSINHQTNLKPSITFPKKWDENLGGGGYGDRYWGISITSDKYCATRFSSGKGVTVHPIILAKNAIVKTLPNASDAIDVDENVIVELYEEGIDAVKLGKSGEDELLVINPKAICNLSEASQYFKQFGLTKDKVPYPSDEQLQELLDACKDYLENKSQNKPKKPMRPTFEYLQKPFDLNGQKYKRYIQDPINDEFRQETENEYQERLKKHESDLKAYNDEMRRRNDILADYDNKVKEFYDSNEYREWEKYLNDLRKKMRI